MKRFILWIILLFSIIYNASSQFIEDALRYTGSNAMITSRIGGLNVSYYGLSDDIGALLFNPAGLTIPGKIEFSIGLGSTRNLTETSILGTKDMLKTNSAYLTHLGFIVPFQVQTQKAAFGLSYFMESDFNNGSRFDAFNGLPFAIDSAFHNKTMIDNETAFGPRTIRANWATNLLLADDFFHAPVNDSLQQKAVITEKGGLHNISGGAGFDLNEFFAVGFSLTGKWGTFDYIRTYEEYDKYYVYQYYETYRDPKDTNKIHYTNLDFDHLYVDETINQTVSGFTGAFGFQAKYKDLIRFGLTVKFPTWYNVEERFYKEVIARFDLNPNTNRYDQFSDTVADGRASLGITTPFVYAAGLSVHYEGLAITAGIEYTDASQIEFSDASPEVQKHNQVIMQKLIGKVNWGFGAEYILPWIPLTLRGSYSGISSPYQDDISNAEQKIIAFGAGFFFGANMRLDAVLRMNDYSEMRSVYGSDNNALYSTLKYTPFSIGLQYTYRY